MRPVIYLGCMLLTHACLEMRWFLNCLFLFVCVATQLKTEVGSLPEGKVKIRLEHDGTLLEVDEDDVEKVGGVTFTFTEINLRSEPTTLGSTI